MAGQPPPVPCPAQSAHQNQMGPRSTTHPPRRQLTQPGGKKKVLPKKDISLGGRVQRLFTSLCAQIDGGHFTNAIKTCDKRMCISIPTDLFDNSIFSHKFSVSYPTTTMPNRQSYSFFYKRNVIAMPLQYSGPLTSPLYLNEHIRLTESNT